MSKKGCDCDACRRGIAVGQLWVMPSAIGPQQTVIIVNIDHERPGQITIFNVYRKYRYRRWPAPWVVDLLSNTVIPWRRA